MSDLPSQSAGSLSTDVVNQVAASQVRNFEIETVASGATTSLRYWIDVEPDLNVQQDTFDIGEAPVAADDIRLQITDADGNVNNYIKLVDANEAGAFADVVNDFVALINTDDAVVASIDAIDEGANTATVRLISAKGEAFTAVTSVGAGTMTLGAVANVVAGDPVADLKRRLFTQFDLVFSIVAGVPTFTPTFEIYDAAETNPAIETTYNLSAVRHSKTITEI